MSNGRPRVTAAPKMTHAMKARCRIRMMMAHPKYIKQPLLFSRSPGGLSWSGCGWARCLLCSLFAVIGLNVVEIAVLIYKRCIHPALLPVLFQKDVSGRRRFCHRSLQLHSNSCNRSEHLNVILKPTQRRSLPELRHADPASPASCLSFCAFRRLMNVYVACRR